MCSIGKGDIIRLLYASVHYFCSMIYLTGATGLVGSHLLAALAAKDKHVKVLRRENSDLSLVKKVFARQFDDAVARFERIEWVNGDLLDYYSLEESLTDVKEIYHCAATVSFHKADHPTMLRVNIRGTENLVNAALQQGVEKFCHVSSIAALGRAEKGVLVTEKTNWKSSGNNSMYAISKYGAEREVWRGIAEGLQAVIVNPSVILGAGNWSSGSAELFSLVDRGLKFYTSGINGFVDVRDVVKAMLYLMENEVFGERFIVSSEDVSYKDLFTFMAKNLGKKPPHIAVSPWMSEIAWRLLAARSLFTGKASAITRETARTASNKHYYSAAKLQQKTGFVFTPIAQSIADICTIYKQENRS